MPHSSTYLPRGSRPPRLLEKKPAGDENRLPKHPPETAFRGRLSTVSGKILFISFFWAFETGRGFKHLENKAFNPVYSAWFRMIPFPDISVSSQSARKPWTQVRGSGFTKSS